MKKVFRLIFQIIGDRHQAALPSEPSQGQPLGPDRHWLIDPN